MTELPPPLLSPFQASRASILVIFFSDENISISGYLLQNLFFSDCLLNTEYKLSLRRIYRKVKCYFLDFFLFSPINSGNSGNCGCFAQMEP